MCTELQNIVTTFLTTALECNNNILLHKARRKCFLYLQETNLELLDLVILRITLLIYSIMHLLLPHKHHKSKCLRLHFFILRVNRDTGIKTIVTYIKHTTVYKIHFISCLYGNTVSSCGLHCCFLLGWKLQLIFH